MGNILTAEGIQADPAKTAAIAQMKSPSSVKELRRFLGMISYLSKFLPQISTRTENLRKLDRKNTKWTWTSQHENDFQEIKK